MRQSRHDDFPVVDEIIVNGQPIRIRCNGDYEQAKHRYWNSLKKDLPFQVNSIPETNSPAQAIRVTKELQHGATNAK